MIEQQTHTASLENNNNEKKKMKDRQDRPYNNAKKKKKSRHARRVAFLARPLVRIDTGTVTVAHVQSVYFVIFLLLLSLGHILSPEESRDS